MSRAGWIFALLVVWWGTSVSAANSEYRELWYRASLNHEEVELNVRLLQEGEAVFIRQLDLALLSLPPPKQEPRYIRGEYFYPARSLPQHDLHIDHLQRRAHFVAKRRPHLSPPPSDDLLLSVTANGQRIRDPQYLRYEHGELMLPEETMRALGIVPRKVWTPALEGAMPLHALAGESYVVDYSRLTLDTRLMPEVLASSKLRVTGRAAEGDSELPVSHGLAAIFNYHLLAGYNETFDEVAEDSNSWSTGLYGLTVGRGNSQCQAEYFKTQDDGWRRLRAFCQKDWPDHRLTALAGDTVGQPGVLTQPVRYTGIRLGTDFALQPYRLVIPNEAIVGMVDQPANLELWIDDSLRLRTEIPPGPFEINEIPLHIGSGQLHAYVTPHFGLRQHFSYGFYVDPALLAPGLSEWALEAGRLRNSGPEAGDSYGDAFLAGSWRRGLTRRLTLGVGMQGSEFLQLASFQAAFTLGNWMAVDAAVAASRTEDAVSDAAWRLRLSHQGDWLNASWRFEHNPANYHELAWHDAVRVPERRSQFSLGLPLGGYFSFLLQETRQRYHDGGDLGLRTAGITARVGRSGSLRLTASELSNTAGDQTIYGLHLTIPFGGNRSASLAARREGDNQWQELNLQRSLPAGPGYGYRINLAEGDAISRGSVDFHLQNSVGRLDLRGSRYDGGQRGSVRASGSVLISGDGVDLSRPSQNSYAMVDVGVADIPVYHGGQLKAYTNSEGLALIPDLRPFERNLIHIRAEDIPVNVQPGSLRASVRAGRRELVRVDFGFQREYYYSGYLMAADGDPVPAGTPIHIEGQPDTVVGEGGEYFIAVPSTSFEFEFMTSDGHCRVRVESDRSEPELVTNLGEHLCQAQTTRDSTLYY